MDQLARFRLADRPARLEAAAVLLTYATLSAVWLLGVQGPQIPYHYWQLLPAGALRQDLWRALADLHAQPPLLNFVFGALLHTADATGIAPETLVAIVQVPLGAVAVLALWALSWRLLPRPALRRAVLALIVLNPFIYASFSHLFYTGYELTFLALTALGALRYFDAPTPRRLAGLLAPALLLVSMRALFHPIWLLLLVVFALHAAGAQRIRQRRGLLAVALLAAMLACAWPAKNLMRFGFFGSSSWTGYNLARGLPVRSPVLSAVFDRNAQTPPDPRWRALAESAVPRWARNSPALADIAKEDGSPNWNHASVLPASQLLGEQAVQALRARPGRLWRRARNYYLTGFSTFEGRNPYTGELGWDVARPDPPHAAAWSQLYETVVLQRFAAGRPTQGPRATTGFAFLFPLLLLAPAALLLRRRGRWSAQERTVAWMGFCTVWVTVLILTVDGMEGNRMRYPVEPFVFLMAAWALDGWLARRSPPPAATCEAGRPPPTPQP